MKTGFQQLAGVALFLASLSGLVLGSPGQPHAEVAHLGVVPGNLYETANNFYAVAENNQDAVEDMRTETWRRFHALHADIDSAHRQEQGGSIPAAISSGRWSHFGQPSGEQQRLKNEALARHQQLALFEHEFQNKGEVSAAALARQHMAINKQIAKYGKMAPLEHVNTRHGIVNFQSLEKLDSRTQALMTPASED